jgi:hypothetical protein
MWPKSERDRLLAALFKTVPIEPKHEHPTKLTGEWPDDMATVYQHACFADFDMFADSINCFHVPDGAWEGGPWRLQELSDTEIVNFDHPQFGRRYKVFYNQIEVGLVEVGAFSRYDGKTKPEVSTHVSIHYADLLPFYELSGFLESLAARNAAGSAEEFAKSKFAIVRALLACLWESKRDAEQNGALEITLIGSAREYLEWRKHRVAR